ncbi:MAG: hypothetical protein ACXVAU_13800 [Mucilaginibacter sp.]
MKSSVIYTCILLAVASSMYFYRIKFNQHPSVLEKFSEGLKNIREHLAPKTMIGIRCEYGNRNYDGSKIVYLLAPVPSNLSGVQDTILYVFPKDIANNNAYFTESTKMSVIWHNSAGDINYILAKKP